MLKFILIFITPLMFFAQSKKVIYFVENDSTISYRDEKNNFIIKPYETSVFNVDKAKHKSEISDNFFYIKKDNEEYAVDREGNFLFYPYYYDNGSDYFNENYIRITDKNSKVGFADKNGKIVIAQQYDYASPFNMGISSYCNGCYLDREKDNEHPPLVGGTWGYIDRNGKEIVPTATAKNPKDFITKDKKYLPYQFAYSKYEYQLIKKIKRFTKEINEMNISEGSLINFEIISKPTADFPYYFIKYYRKDKPHYFSTDSDDQEGFNFYIDKNENIYINHLVFTENGNSYKHEFIKIEDWIKKIK